MKTDTGTTLEAEFTIAVVENERTIVFESRGQNRNRDYLPALELLLRRLGDLGATLNGVYVESRGTRTLKAANRRVDLTGYRFPIELRHVSDFTDLRSRLTNAQASIGRARDASGSGIPTKRIRLYLGAIEEFWGIDYVGLYLAGGHRNVPVIAIPNLVRLFREAPGLDIDPEDIRFVFHNSTENWLYVRNVLCDHHADIAEPGPDQGHHIGRVLLQMVLLPGEMRKGEYVFGGAFRITTPPRANPWAPRFELMDLAPLPELDRYKFRIVARAKPKTWVRRLHAWPWVEDAFDFSLELDVRPAAKAELRKYRQPELFDLVDQCFRTGDWFEGKPRGARTARFEVEGFTRRDGVECVTARSLTSKNKELYVLELPLIDVLTRVEVAEPGTLWDGPLRVDKTFERVLRETGRTYPRDGTSSDATYVAFAKRLADRVLDAVGGPFMFEDWSEVVDRIERPDESGSDFNAVERGIRKLSRSGGQGFSSNPERNKAVELHAMTVAEKWLKDEHGFTDDEIDDTSDTRPYDLVGRRGAFTRYAEVKGTTGGGEHVLVTAGEVRWAREHPQECALVVVSEIEVSADGNGGWVASGGHVEVVQPWVPADDELEPISYRCRVRGEVPPADKGD